MYRAKICSFTIVNQNKDFLDDLNKTSAFIWNDVLSLANDYRKTNLGKWISKTELQKLTKNKYPLHSQSVQAVVHRYVENRAGAKELRKINPKTKYPYKEKHFFNTKWVDLAFSIDGDVVELSNGRGREILILKVNNLPQGDIKSIELVYRGSYKLAITYDDRLFVNKNTFSNKSAIDLGEIHPIASTCTNGNQLLITCRELRSKKQLRNKKLAELNKKLSKCKKGSRNYKKYKKAINYTLSKTENQVKDILHKTTKQYVDWCIENQVKEVYIGRVEGVQRNTSIKKGKTKKTRTKKVNQKISQWNFGVIKQYLAYKLKAEGISLKEVDESYSSQTCPACGIRRKANNRNYKCKCGYKAHRDLHGSANILSKQLYKRFEVIKTNDLQYSRPNKVATISIKPRGLVA